VKGGIIHTPYDGSSKPFTIGLASLDLKDWIEVDENLISYLDEKLNLYKALPDKVLVADEGTEDAQGEVLCLLADHLPKRFPDFYQLHDKSMTIAGQRHVGIEPSSNDIATAGLLVQEDLVLMRKSPAGWRLAAASVCFPSAWDLVEKFKKPLGEIHGHVPGFASGTRNDSIIERMFDNLSPERLVIRWNWSLNDTDKLYLPLSKHREKRRFGEGATIADRVFIRLERQTFRKLPKSGDVLFTIRTHVNPLDWLERRPDGAALAFSLEQILMNMTLDEAKYKGIANERERLSARLRMIAAQA